MTFVEMLQSQLTDIFRIGLLIALVYTAGRTAGVVGQVIPLALGLVFVAVIIPATMPRTDGAGMWPFVGVGLIANGIILAIILAVQAAYLRWRR